MRDTGHHVTSCDDCGARLSQYRKPRERICGPCDRSRNERSFTRSQDGEPIVSKADEAFRLRWRGFDWSAISQLVGYPTSSAANSAAREYAKRNRLNLP